MKNINMRRVLLTLLLFAGWLIIADLVILHGRLSFDMLQGLAYLLATILCWILSDKVVRWAFNEKDDVNGG